MNWEYGDIYDEMMDDLAEDAATRNHWRRVRGQDDAPEEEEQPT